MCDGKKKCRKNCNLCREALLLVLKSPVMDREVLPLVLKSPVVVYYFNVNNKQNDKQQ
jgi:hypothetical protein